MLEQLRRPEFAETQISGGLSIFNFLLNSTRYYQKSIGCDWARYIDCIRYGAFKKAKLEKRE